MDGTDPVVDFLEHYGVRGMRWGQRLKDRKARKSETSSDAKASIDVRTKAKTHSTKALTNKQLQDAINRMNLEQNFKRLAVNEKSGVSRWISSTMLEIGKKEVQQLAAKKAASFVLKKTATAGLG